MGNEVFGVTELRNLRKEKGLCMAELAFRVGMQQPEFSILERGWKRIPEKKQEKIAEILGVARETIFDEAGVARAEKTNP